MTRLLLLGLLLCGVCDAQVLRRRSVQSPAAPISGGVTDYTNSVISWHKFPEGSGTSAADSSGNANTGTLTTGAGWSGGAATLDGSSTAQIGVTSFSHTFTQTTPFSGMAWIKTSSSAAQAILSNWDFPNNPGWNFDISDLAAHKLSFYLSSPDGSFVRGKRGGTSVDDNNWHHVAFTYDGSSSAAGIKLYVDGVAETLTLFQDAAPGTAVNNSFEIGNISGNRITWNGSLDDVRLYNAELTAPQVEQIYTNGLAQAGGHGL